MPWLYYFPFPLEFPILTLNEKYYFIYRIWYPVYYFSTIVATHTDTHMYEILRNNLSNLASVVNKILRMWLEVI